MHIAVQAASGRAAGTWSPIYRGFVHTSRPPAVFAACRHREDYREQIRLVLNGLTGEVRPVDTGIPQGSPAVPILFLDYL